MLYLLDANVLITANNLYYPLEAVPEFWQWLVYQGEQGIVKMPIETFEEVKDGSTDGERDALYAWINDETNKRALILDEEVDQAFVARIVQQGYAVDLSDQEIDQIGRDPFLIAYALAEPGQRCVVTTEVSSPRKQRQNRRIPDVCTTLGIDCIDTFAMSKALGFTTSWRQP